MAEARDRTVEVGVEVKLDPDSIKRLLGTLDQIHGSLMRAAQAMATMLQEVADAVGPLAVEDQSVIIATRSMEHLDAMTFGVGPEIEQVLEGSAEGATGEVAEGTQRSIYDELDDR